MEDELALTLNLAFYQEADLGDYITFMMNFRTVLNSLKPSEGIQLETVYAMDIIDLLMQVLPDHEPHDVSWLECFSYFEPADLHSDYMERGAAKGKGSFIQALWTEYAKPKLYGLVYKAWRQHGAQTLTTWTQLAQAVLDGGIDESETNFRVLSGIKAGLKSQSHHLPHGGRESLCTKSCPLPRGADLGDYINFMVQFRSSLNALKPAEVIALKPIYTVDLVEQMQQLLLNLDPRDIPTFESFAYFEPADVFHD
ncbi:hypothetical protein TNIN_47691 [Trichonephila inaurata madagascariensis]|uniref:Uncharacterized protein n=1 Tax=Trichonephila inaurata madagascariensis TaxID=2747483 RepID=A0A8X6Y1S9_9ARAC|nr:hypothetical protein TNIN_47691 [Trichonephila inaurata madagascariensis]